MRSWLFLCVVIVAGSSVLWAKPGLVDLKDGSEFVADVTDGDNGMVVFTIHGVTQTYPRDQIASIDWLVNIDQRFNSRLLKLGPHDVPGRLELADWARRIERFDLARKAVDEALKIDAEDENAQAMSRLIQHEMRDFTIVAEGKSSLPTIPEPIETPYLNADQINVIRQTEIKAGEGFRVTFLNDVRARYLGLHLIDAHSFYSMTDDEQAEKILSQGDPAMAMDVRIETDPQSLKDFHDRIEPFIYGGCAISGCHDSHTAAGGFGLFTGDETPAAWHTNFFILETWRGRKGPQAGQMMVDVPHPDVPGFRRIFANEDDPHYQAMIYWIGVSLRPAVAGYPTLDYQPPWSQAANSIPK